MKTQPTFSVSKSTQPLKIQNPIDGLGKKRCIVGVGDSLLRHLTAYKTKRADQIVNNIPGTNMEERKEAF